MNIEQEQIIDTIDNFNDEQLVYILNNNPLLMDLEYPLARAFEVGNAQATRILLTTGADLNEAFLEATLRGYLNAIQRMLQMEIPEHIRIAALIDSISENNVYVTQILIEMTPQEDVYNLVNAYGGEPLLHAFITQNHEIVQLLVDTGAEIDDDIFINILEDVESSKLLGTVKFFVQLRNQRLQDETEDEFPIPDDVFLASIYRGNPEVVEYLLQQGANPFNEEAYTEAISYVHAFNDPRFVQLINKYRQGRVFGHVGVRRGLRRYPHHDRNLEKSIFSYLNY